MAIVLGPNRYGKAETRVVRVTRDGGTHSITDLNVSVALSGDLADTHLTGDNANVLPTDTQKNTVYAFAKQHGIASPEAFALLLARHFTSSQETITGARVEIEEYPWNRLGPHSFSRDGSAVRTAEVVVAEPGTEVFGGLTGLTLLNSTDSEFSGFIRDPYTTLAETSDRILATAVDARWRFITPEADFDAVFGRARAAMIEAFTGTYSYSLQQTLFAMGKAVLEACPDLAEIRLRLPNKHHFVVDCTPYGLDAAPEVFHADDRPYGLIEGSVVRDDVS
ncbi:factor-independent urate hydroxylase [Catenuloplanes atrovinosus]|uniref:Uricase n=1 Tax=Catenuloplanes atrovinosus TaxID=137266 RepID=A0AAE4C9U6_9ACTN|nr:urate oxidase [Catenuloplanes atrovinosus]MDR7273945.1 urate oxidase [Catenuloplanes atrovinosus]